MAKKTFGQVLRELRLQSGKSLQEVAKLTDIEEVAQCSLYDKYVQKKRNAGKGSPR